MSHHDYATDAELIHDAVEGLGTDESKLIAIIGARSRQDLAQIDLAYRAKQGQTLASRLKSESGGNFGRLLIDVVQTPDVTDAIYIHDSMAGAGTDDKVLIEFLATRTAPELEHIKLAYVALYNKSLEQDIKGDTSGKYEDLLVGLLNGNRGRNDHGVDAGKVAADAQRLHDNASELTYIAIFSEASHQHIMAVRDAYQHKYGKTLVEAIKKNFSGKFEDALVILATPRSEYFADTLLAAMKGFGTDEKILVRIIGTRYGVDLADIKRVFQQKNGKTLYAWVESEISGDFKNLALNLIQHSQ